MIEWIALVISVVALLVGAWSYRRSVRRETEANQLAIMRRALPRDGETREQWEARVGGSFEYERHSEGDGSEVVEGPAWVQREWPWTNLMPKGSYGLSTELGMQPGPPDPSWVQKVPMVRVPCRDYDPPGLQCRPCRSGDPDNCQDPRLMPKATT